MRPLNHWPSVKVSPAVSQVNSNTCWEGPRRNTTARRASRARITNNRTEGARIGNMPGGYQEPLRYLELWLQLILLLSCLREPLYLSVLA